jgi:hypothetical protein
MFVVLAAAGGGGCGGGGVADAAVAVWVVGLSVLLLPQWIEIDFKIHRQQHV